MTAKDVNPDQKKAAGRMAPVFGVSAGIFSIVMAAGIVSAGHLAVGGGVRSFGAPKVSVPDFLAIFTLATLLFLSLIYFLKAKKLKRAIFKIMFASVVFTGTTVFLNVWIDRQAAFMAALFSVAAWWVYPKVLVHNASLTLAMLGAGIFLGHVFSPAAAALLLLVFSVYDLVAVYVTKHMVVMAKEMMANGALAALFMPMHLSGLKEGVDRIAAGGEKFLVLGGGDIVFPLFFCVSVARYYGTAGAAVTAVFATAGFCASFCQFLSQGRRRPIPALPPIALFSLLGYALVLFLYK